jgi:2-keto-4-pentenoate hydratase/2-oxohepta-3-ene-1,7-dioic acid hydratase in catechol pathway
MNTPSKVVCIGRNYVDHIKELNNETPTEPVIFMKPNSAISNEININASDEIHYEGEISFIVNNGKINAVGFGLDLTKREIQNKLKAKGLPWERAKAFDGSAVFSDFVEFNGNTENLRMELWINGLLQQSGGVDLMLYKPEEILQEINTFSSLENGDIIMTGTPSGVGVVNKNDVFIGKIYNNDKQLVKCKWIVQK